MFLPSVLALHAYHPKEKKGWLTAFFSCRNTSAECHHEYHSIYTSLLPPPPKKTCLTFVFRCKIFHSPTWVAVEGSCNQRDFLLSATILLSHQKRGLHPESCCPFHLAVKVFFFLCVCALYDQSFQQEDGRHGALSLLFIVSHEVAKSFTEQPGHRRQRLRVPEEVVTMGMSGSKRRKTDSGLTEGEDATECEEEKNINWNVLSWNGSAFARERNENCQFGILLESAVFQFNGREKNTQSLTCLFLKYKHAPFWLLFMYTLSLYIYYS